MENSINTIKSKELKSGDGYVVGKEGSLGLLALGDLGLEAWKARLSNKEFKPSNVTLPENDDKQKLILIGWDAADWKIINPMLDAGLMPNLSALINEGVMGNLATLDPPYSPMLWTSIATGKRAYDHGIHGFTELNTNGDNIQPVMSSSRKVKAIWNILSEKHKKCHVVGWWPSHPAEKINGIAISNLFQKSSNRTPENWLMSADTVYPKDAGKRFEHLRIHSNELTGNHILPFVPEAWRVDQSKDKRLQMIAKITAETASLHNAFTNIIRTEKYDLAAVYLDGIDHYCHGFMKYFPPHRSHISKPEFDLYKHVIRSAYRYHDMMLGRIMELAPENATIMLISDHGFQPDHLRPRDIPKEPAGPAHEHSPYGIIVAKGPSIKKDELIFGASVIDITPTLLHFFGLPVAQDMEGKVLHNLFQNYSPETKISTYESDKRVDVEDQVSEEFKHQLLNHLVELGYIEDHRDNLKGQVKRTKNECDFNLARAYIDGHKIQEATSILERLFYENKSTPQYAIRLAACYQFLGKNDEARDIIEHLKNLGVYQKEALDVFDGGLLLGNGLPEQALKKFHAAKKNIRHNSTAINLQIAQCFIQVNKLHDAIECLIKELENDYDNDYTHQLLASVNFRLKNYKEAAEHSLTSLGLNFQNTQSHATLGRSLYHLGQYEDAAHALEQCLTLMPHNNSIRELIIHLYDKLLVQVEKSDFHKDKLKSNYLGEIFVVSGLPRSGTSMLMQMLVNGGMEAFVDDSRDIDENNPNGYFEHSLVKNLSLNSNWMQLTDHKLIKIVAPVIMNIPLNYKYKVVFVERSVDEVAQSQTKMLSRVGSNEAVMPNLEKELNASLQKTKDWLDKRSNVEVLYVNHADIINAPNQAAEQINRFYNFKLDTNQMANSVNKNLYREQVRL